MKVIHVHKYLRRNLSRNPGVKPYLVFACIGQGCNHYIPMDHALNKISLCNKCNKEFIMKKKHLSQVKPHCDDCTNFKPKTVKKKQKVEELLKILKIDELFPDNSE